MSEDVSSKVKKIVADHLGIDEAKVQEDSSFIDDLGADSFLHSHAFINVTRVSSF